MALEIVREIMTLSGSTQARLFGTNKYEEIEKERADWIKWVEKADKVFTTWQEAWTGYIAHPFQHFNAEQCNLVLHGLRKEIDQLCETIHHCHGDDPESNRLIGVCNRMIAGLEVRIESLKQFDARVEKLRDNLNDPDAR